MKNMALLFICIAISGCFNVVDKRKLEAAQSAYTIRILEPVNFEDRPRERLLPGNYVERYASPLGRVLVSEGQLLEFTPSIGEKRTSIGGFIILKERRGFGRLFRVGEKGSGASAFLGGAATFAGDSMGAEGDLFLLSDFPLSIIRANPSVESDAE